MTGNKELEAKKDEQIDPWALLDPPDTGKKWNEKTCGEKFKSTIKMTFFFILFLGFLYLFICSLGFLTSAFKLLGGRVAGEAFTQNEILTNPICDLMIGVLATVLLQSSSTVTSICVAMVASEVIPIRPAIFIVMGANIGTSVTNTIVALGQAMDGDDFRRAFAGATVHDMFNWLSVLTLLPIEWITGAFGSWKDCGVLCQITKTITNSVRSNEGFEKTEILSRITKPFIHRIMWVSSKSLVNKINDLAQWNETANGPYVGDTIMKRCYENVQVPYVETINGSCTLLYNTTKSEINCGFLFEGVKGKWSDAAAGALLLVLALVVLLGCLICMVKVLQVLMQGSVARIIKRFINANIPLGKFGQFLTGYIAIAIGAGTTMIIQSSSVFTSALTPLVGVGILHIKRMYPLTLGANLGTTLTAVLAALALDDNFADGLQIALCHFFFNLIGVLIWYPLPFMRKLPIALAKRLGEKTGGHRWFAGVYIVLVFVLIPGSTFLLSLAGWQYLLGIAGPIFVLVVIVCIINAMQTKCSEKLPSSLQDWSCLPKPLHSLTPYDRICGACCVCCDNKEKDAESVTLDYDLKGQDGYDGPESFAVNGYDKSEKL